MGSARADSVEIDALERVRPMEPVGSRRAPGDVAPALGRQRAERAEDDSYAGSASRQGRGMEDDDPEDDGEGNHQTAPQDGKTVNLVA